VLTSPRNTAPEGADPAVPRRRPWWTAALRPCLAAARALSRPDANAPTLSDSIRTGSPAAALAAADPTAVRANKLDLLERLADALAHEIKNPLHSMVINLEVLKRRLSRANGEGSDLLRYATVLGEELDRVHRRIELLLRLSRPERGGTDDTTLDELVDEVMELVNVEARQRDARVEYERGTHMARVRLGRQQARQIILNLVLDALDGVAAGDTLRVAVRVEGGHAELVVVGGPSSDGGERLAVAAALAEAAGGRLDVDGATRTLALPAHRGE
jgi:signal transduction histidine kinase